MVWDELKKPIVGLSPMDGVTDASFRFITKKFGNPDVMFTEFVSTDGICHSAVRLFRDLIFVEEERPIIAQVFGNTPKTFRITAVLLCELGFDGIDINMGCPANSVAQRGGGAALITTPKLAQSLVKATKQGIEDWNNGAAIEDLPFTDAFKKEVKQRKTKHSKKYTDRNRKIPVSVKTRIGFSSPVIGEWIPALLETQPSVISIHGRTLKQQYGGKADWSEIGKAVELAKGSDVRIFGNGDVSTRDDALERVKTYGVDGVLIGRSSFGNPWVFKSPYGAPTWEMRKEAAVAHTLYYEKLYGNGYFLPMRKHLGWYVKDIRNASEVRQRLFQANSSSEVKRIFKRVAPSGFEPETFRM